MKTIRLLPILLLPLLALLLAGCGGPAPRVQSYNAAPPPAGSDQPFHVEAVVVNTGGSGQIEVVVNLIDKKTGQTLAQSSNDVSMEANETQHVNFSIDLPASAKNMDPANIRVDVEAHYPIE